MKKRTPREILAETLLELTSLMPVDKITVRKIVEESGLSVQTFYNNFKDKSDLILWIYANDINRMSEKFETEQYSFRDFLSDNVELIESRKDYFINALQNTRGQDSFARQSVAYVYNALVNCICRKKNIRSLNTKVEIELRMYIYSVYMILVDWVMKEIETDKQTLMLCLEDSISASLKSWLP